MVNYLVSVSRTNTTTYIHKKCFEDFVSLLPDNIENIKINFSNTNVIFSPKYNNVEIKIELKVSKKEESIAKKVLEIKSQLEFISLALLGYKPKNIIIYVLGTY